MNPLVMEALRPLYAPMRRARRALPAPLARWLLETGLLLKPGLETRAPEQAVERYLRALAERGLDVAGREVMVFGYGGHLGVGLDLLRRGAQRVTLCDRFARPRKGRTAALQSWYPEAFIGEGAQAAPDPRRLRLLHVDIREFAREQATSFDLILSSSVFEHLHDAAGVAEALRLLTRPQGAHLHYVDVRDHFFRLPFQMLTYSEPAWRRLDPPTHLNRLRPWDYETLFEGSFRRVEFKVEQAELPAFLAALPRIRPEFLCGDEELDAAGVISIFAADPVSPR